jgi:hypothetical protein
MLQTFVTVAFAIAGAGRVWAADGAEWKALHKDGKTVRFRNLRVKELP